MSKEEELPSWLQDGGAGTPPAASSWDDPNTSTQKKLNSSGFPNPYEQARKVGHTRTSPHWAAVGSVS